MRLSVITPVGPGHEQIVDLAIKSVRVMDRDPFSTIDHIIIDDTKGQLGRSAARNKGMRDSDWYFFLDADDTIYPYAARFLDETVDATFGAVDLSGKLYKKNVFPCTREDLFKYKAQGTLSMGFFIKSEVARRLKFNEALDIGEDFDFYLRIPTFVKIRQALVRIGYDVPSAGGPRGYDKIDWCKACEVIVDKYKENLSNAN
jgi:glycosyltransferase involved in cell wall biosynthesis